MIPAAVDHVARHEQAALRARDDQDRARIEGRFGSVLAAVDRERHVHQPDQLAGVEVG